MKINKVLLYTLPIIGILLSGSLIIYNFARKRAEKKDDGTGGLTPEDELKKREEEALRRIEELQKEVLEKRLKDEKAAKELEKRHREQVEAFEKEYKKALYKPPKVNFILDVGLPALTPTTYKTGLHTISLNKTTFTSDPDLADFTHTMEGQKFIVFSLQFGGRLYKIEPVEAIMVASIAFANDPGFCYFLLIPGENSKPVFYKNEGDEFVRCDKQPLIKKEMIEMAVKFNRLPKGIQPPKTPEEPAKPEKPEYVPTAPPTLETTPTTKPPTLNFNLTFQDKFMVGSQEVKLNITHEFDGVYNGHKYFVERGTFTPTSYSIGNVTQSGLPVNIPLETVMIYFHSVTMGQPVGTPLVIILDHKGKSTRYLNAGDNNWIESKGPFKEELDLIDSRVNRTVTINLCRRSDYYRNGTGASQVETSLDMNVYVEPDMPIQGWTTYIHKLEEGGEGGIEKTFFIRQLLCNSQKFDLCLVGNVGMEVEVDFVNVYGINDEPISKPPLVFGLTYINGSQGFFTFDNGKYVFDPNINPSNLGQKLQSI